MESTVVPKSEGGEGDFKRRIIRIKYQERLECLGQEVTSLLIAHSILDNENRPQHHIQNSPNKRTLLKKQTNYEKTEHVTAKCTTTGLSVEDTCHRIWTKFSNKHKKSPSHINNNVQVCDKFSVDFEDVHLRHRKRENLPNVPKSRISRNASETSDDLLNDMKNWSLIYQIVRFLHLILIIIKIVGVICISIALFYCLITLHKPSQAFVSRHTQDLIYPFMRAIRIFSLPVVRQLPFLSDYYEESCLLANPFYAIDLECWPCENVRHVIDLTGFNNFSSEYHHSGIPFIVKDAVQKELTIEDIKRIYTSNQPVMNKAFVETNILGLTTLEEVFDPTNEAMLKADEFHLEWNVNRVTIARLWRKYFLKPYFIPATTEVSVQHYLFIDQISSRSYRLPLTEFANVFLTQATGIRSIVLIPTENCQRNCKVVSAVLQPKDVLFYNWLFWRPMSVAADSSVSKSISVSYIGSFY